MQHLNGLHHVTAITGSAQQNLNFYRNLLGLRFVKKTVNFDDPSAYHFYFGDRIGSPGTIMTFFAFEGARPGRRGNGEVAATHFAVPEGSLPFWRQYLTDHGVEAVGGDERFGEERLVFKDPDGTDLVLTQTDWQETEQIWATDEIGAEVAIRGFRGVSMILQDAGATAELLQGVMGYRQTGSDGSRLRFEAETDRTARFLEIDVRADAARALSGAGSVHHVAFSTPDSDSQQAVREELISAGFEPTPQIDRDYFKAIYFRTPGGVLFEVATDVPGFAVDEPVDMLGQTLKLPKQHEDKRARLEQSLPEVV
ncbi:MAG: VOC family protein [Geminicoccaceae bacterium]